ncbi:MAG: peptidoglycan DD-metalloendopeptidase family protein [Fibrobacterota bacterium]
MKQFRFLQICIVFSAALFIAPASVPDIDFALAWEPDSTQQDNSGAEEGEDFNSLFEDVYTEIDTTYAWSNYKINSGRFDYKTLGPGDTIRIPLVDSAHKRIYAHPFENYVSSDFGRRRYGWHYGVDVKLWTGNPVKCAFDGIVRVVTYDPRGYGRVVVVRHHSGLETLYAHLSRAKVKPRQKVKAGDIIGLGGNTGRSSGSHLHFEMRYYGEPFNPNHIIDFENYRLKNDILVLTRENFEYLTVQRQTVYHTIRKGDTLGAIARRYGTGVSTLCTLNGIGPRTVLRIGRRLMVRTAKKGEKKLTLQVKKSSEATQ